jgi:hypothetical protein
MRALLLIASLLLLVGEANAQPCYGGCGCQGTRGSGWRLIDTPSRKCVSCDEIQRCGPNKGRCRFEACSHIKLIACPEHIPPARCSLK